ncbi:MAG: LLM class flavin-dependent oxidoreductase, partial [Candidatus Hydrothermarchaeales archaeon]
RVWVGEDIFYRELFTYLSILSLKTERILLASGITSPYVRGPHVLASSVSAIVELSKNRFSLGLGAGGLPEVERLIGERPKKPVEALEKAVLFLKERRSVEVYLGVRGPRMLELAGRIADGVILSGPKGYVKEAIEIVGGSAKKRGKVKKVLWNAFLLGEDSRLVEKVTSVMLESMPEFALRHIEDRRNVVDELCIYGSKDRILQGLEEFEEMGIDEFVIGPPYGKDPLEVIKAMEGR